jgi:hypothetical protein
MDETRDSRPANEPPIPMSPTQAALHEVLTGWPVLVLFGICLAVVWALAPERAAVAVWILCRLALGAFAGNLFGSLLIPIGDPQQLTGIARGNAINARAICIGFGMLAAGWTL